MPADDPPGIETFSAYAAHEAAHAVITAALGITVCRVLVVQLTDMMKLFHKGSKPKEDCSHSQPDCGQYRAAGSIKRRVIARAGEVGQRLGGHVIDPEHWSGDRKEIQDETGLCGTELDLFLETLGTTIETWLSEPAQNEIWKNLTNVLIETRKPQPNDPERFRSVLEGDKLQELLKATPEFPTDRIPTIPKA
jgi:hypothetical protein